MEEEHIEAEYLVDGVRVLVSDRAFQGKTDAELEAIRKNARQVAWTIQAAKLKQNQKTE